MPVPTCLPGPTPNSVRTPSGQTLAVSSGWQLLQPGEATRTRRVRGQRRELRRMLAQRSKELLGAYSRDEAIARCLLAKALAHRSTNSGGGGYSGFTH